MSNKLKEKKLLEQQCFQLMKLSIDFHHHNPHMGAEVIDGCTTLITVLSCVYRDFFSLEQLVEHNEEMYSQLSLIPVFPTLRNERSVNLGLKIVKALVKISNKELSQADKLFFTQEISSVMIFLQEVSQDLSWEEDEEFLRGLSERSVQLNEYLLQLPLNNS